jgi:hypothetical protein
MIKNNAVEFINLTNIRKDWLDSSVASSIPDGNYNFIGTNNNCSIVKQLSSSIYNIFCTNFQAKIHQVYVFHVINIFITLTILLLTFLYAIELQSLTVTDDLSS